MPMRATRVTAATAPTPNAPTRKPVRVSARWKTSVENPGVSVVTGSAVRETAATAKNRASNRPSARTTATLSRRRRRSSERWCGGDVGPDEGGHGEGDGEGAQLRHQEDEAAVVAVCGPPRPRGEEEDAGELGEVHHADEERRMGQAEDEDRLGDVLEPAPAVGE